MKNNTKPASKTPIDVLRALTTARRAAEELVAALELIDPAAFGTGALHANAVDAAGLATATVLELVSARPLTKTERAARAAAEPIAPAAPEPVADAAFETLAPEPESSAIVADAEVEAQPEPAPSVEELRRIRKRERDRASAARRRAAAAA